MDMDDFLQDFKIYRSFSLAMQVGERRGKFQNPVKIMHIHVVPTFFPPSFLLFCKACYVYSRLEVVVFFLRQNSRLWKNMFVRPAFGNSSHFVGIQRDHLVTWQENSKSTFIVRQESRGENQLRFETTSNFLISEIDIFQGQMKVVWKYLNIQKCDILDFSKLLFQCVC